MSNNKSLASVCTPASGAHAGEILRSVMTTTFGVGEQKICDILTNAKNRKPGDWFAKGLTTLTTAVHRDLMKAPRLPASRSPEAALRAVGMVVTAAANLLDRAHLSSLGIPASRSRITPEQAKFILGYAELALLSDGRGLHFSGIKPGLEWQKGNDPHVVLLDLRRAELLIGLAVQHKELVLPGSELSPQSHELRSVGTLTALALGESDVVFKEEVRTALNELLHGGDAQVLDAWGQRVDLHGLHQAGDWARLGTVFKVASDIRADLLDQSLGFSVRPPVLAEAAPSM